MVWPILYGKWFLPFRVWKTQLPWYIHFLKVAYILYNILIILWFRLWISLLVLIGSITYLDEIYSEIFTWRCLLLPFMLLSPVVKGGLFCALAPVLKEDYLGSAIIVISTVPQDFLDLIFKCFLKCFEQENVLFFFLVLCTQTYITCSIRKFI